MGNKLTRREMLASMGATAAVPLVAGYDGALAASLSAPAASAAPANARGIYREIARISNNGGTHGWLKDFSEPVDKLITDVLVAVDTTPLKYDPCSFESLLVSASERLDVCLVRRQDIVELLDRAVRQALGYELFDKLRAEDDKIEAATSLVTQSKVAKASADEAAKEFSTAEASAKLTHGFKFSARGAAKIAEDAEVREGQRLIALQNKAAIQRKHAETISSFSESPGHVINYEHRAKRVMSLLVDDITEAYLKLSASQAGMKECMGLDLPLPALTFSPDPARKNGSQWNSNNALDALVLWSRDAIRKLEIQYAKEVVLTVKVPLVQKYSKDGAGDPVGNVPNRAYMVQQFDLGGKDLGKGPFELVLDDSFFMGLKNPRLLAIGARLVPLNQDGFNNGALLACRVMVDAPARSAGSMYDGAPRRSMLLGDVSRDESVMITAEAIRNADPRGKWHIKVLRGVLGYGEPQLSRSDLIGDIRLELQVAGRLDQGAV